MPMMPVLKSNKLPSAGPSIEEEAEEVEGPEKDGEAPAPPPPSEPHSPRAATPEPQPPPAPGTGAYEYIFVTDEHIAPPTLAQPEVDNWAEMKTEVEEDVIKADVDMLKPAPIAVEEVPPIVEKVVAEQPTQTKPLNKSNKVGAVQQHRMGSAGGATESKRVGRMVAVAPKSLLQVLIELDDHFLKSSKSAREVSKLLEATKMHYHSNFIDSGGHIDHSARVMQVITWNRSCKNINQARDRKDEYQNPELETLATILEKMLAWEKKLCEEVKECELMKIIYQRKVASLNKLQNHSSHSEALEKAKAAVSHLHTRYIVDIQTVESTVAEINYLRDNQLYFKLVYLVEGMAKMWETMHVHHDCQLKIINEVKYHNFTIPARETSQEHHTRTVQLWKVVSEWHSQFDKLINYQKEFINALCSWLKLNLIPVETGLKEKASSPQNEVEPAIKLLLFAWRDHLQNLPVDSAKSSIKSFAEVMHTIVLHQDDMSRQRGACEIALRDLQRKKRAYEDWYQKYRESKAALSAATNNPDSTEGANQDDPVTDRQIVVEAAEKKLKDEQEEYMKLCKQVRDKSLGCLRTHLPELFLNVSEFALKCSIMYNKLASIAKSQAV